MRRPTTPEYRKRARAQDFAWVMGLPFHEPMNDECCPDGSCCKPDLFIDNQAHRWTAYNKRWTKRLRDVEVLQGQIETLAACRAAAARLQLHDIATPLQRRRRAAGLNAEWYPFYLADIPEALRGRQFYTRAGCLARRDLYRAGDYRRTYAFVRAKNDL